MLMANENGSCGRSEALVAYLYGELPAADAQDFSAHAARCTQCSAELVEFGGLHRSMSEWRTATVGQMAQPAIEPAVWMPEISTARVAVPARRSLRSVIVELFTVSPMWARAGVGLAVLLLVALGLVYVLPLLRSNPSSVASGVQPQPAPLSPVAPVAPVVDTPPVTPINNGSDIARTPAQVPPSISSAPATAPKLAANRHQRRPVLASPSDIAQRQELARLTNDVLGGPSDHDNSVPRLSDLLTDGDVPMVEPNQ